jgi:hypothetical protein
MGAVTIGAIRSILLLLVVSLTVATGKVLIKYLCMTGGTVYRFVGRAGSFQVIAYFGMALGALNVLVYRIRKFIGVHKQRNSITFYHSVEILIIVALPARIVRGSRLDLGHIDDMRRVAA